MSTFKNELQDLINRHSKENDSDTPDFILAEYLQSCLDNYSSTVKARDKWFGVDMWDKKGKDFPELVSDEMKKLNTK